ncbi:hypothetical protein BDP27DRAFT_1479879 [Rhodocollybia butyracea]|uniref:CHAT domain-containing protein n=1 Tax=Rhodocollybia butyracea TaxID=206335 RepID=A0A9P5PFW9_9AGAR|nr:hypothetical protein BDP27DRAFT_1479879 [Rhodocollybia butyracea]
MDHFTGILKATKDGIIRAGAALLQFCYLSHAALLRALIVYHDFRFEQTGHLEHLEKYIQLNRKALLLLPVGNPHHGHLLHNLSLGLWNRFQQTGHLGDLDEAVQLDRDVLLLWPVGHPDRGGILIDLSQGLQDRFQQTGDLGDLNESVQLDRDALLLCPMGYPGRGRSLNNLGMNLLSRFQQTGHLGDLDDLSMGLSLYFQLTGHLGDLDEAIQLCQEALLLGPVGHPNHSTSLSNLSTCLILRFQQTGHLEDIDESIQLNRDAVLLKPMAHLAHVLSLGNLGMGLNLRFQQTGNLRDLNESIQFNRESIRLQPMGHPNRSTSLSNLSIVLSDRFQQTGNLGDLDESVQLNREALLLQPMGHPNRSTSLSNLSHLHRALSLNNLSLGLNLRFQETGHMGDLDESVQLNREVLLLYPLGHVGRGRSLNNLSTSLILRFQHSGHLGDLDESVQLNREALLLHPVGHLAHGTSLNNLSSTLNVRFQETGQLGDLDECLQLHRDALLLHPVGNPNHGTLLGNLGVDLNIRFQQTGHLGDLEESVQLNREALLLHPMGHQNHGDSLENLGMCLQSYFQQTRRLGDLDESIQLNRDALLLRPMGHKDHGLSLNTLSLGLNLRFQQTGHLEDLTECVSASKQAAEDIYSPVSVCLRAVHHWVDFTQPHHDLAQSNLDAYIMGLSLISRSLSMIPMISLQYQHLLSAIGVPEFVSDGASQAIQLSQLSLAVEIIEQGRGLLWSELRGLRAPMDRLRALDPSLVDELMRLNHRLEILSMQNLADRGTGLYVQTDSSYQHQLEVNRDPFGHSLSEKRHLLHAQSEIIEKIQKIAGFETFLGRKSFDELKYAAKHGPIIVVNCKGLYEQVETLVEQLTEARTFLKASPKRYNHVLRATLKDLWDLVVSPVVTKLQELRIPKMSRIYWCPTSILSTLPLHAAGPISPGTKEFLPDLYISSYTPTLTALIDAFNTTKSSSQLPHLLVAGQYDKSLPRTKEETDQVLQYQKHIPTTSLEGPAATKEALEKALVDHEWLHIASHACHTAEQSPDSVHNEVIHLAAAMQFCGFRGVVGTMWEMADIDGPDMVKDFYSHLFSDENLSRCNEVGAQARALSEAIKKMRGRKGVTLERITIYGNQLYMYGFWSPLWYPCERSLVVVIVFGVHLLLRAAV